MLPDLLRDLGAPFPAVWDRLQTVHRPREAARLFAKVLGQLDLHGPAVVVPALEAALSAGTPLLLALSAPTPPWHRVAAEALPAILRELDVPSGCAADYDDWLRGAAV